MNLLIQSSVCNSSKVKAFCLLLVLLVAFATLFGHCCVTQSDFVTHMEEDDTRSSQDSFLMEQDGVTHYLTDSWYRAVTDGVVLILGKTKRWDVKSYIET